MQKGEDAGVGEEKRERERLWLLNFIGFVFSYGLPEHAAWLMNFE